jgi:FkbM family methyltransferase
MIETFLRYIEDKHSECVIFDVGSRDCAQAIEFYHNFPKAKIYAFECNPNTLALCKKNIERYSDRITLIEGAVCDYNGDITFYPINQEKTITTWKDGNPGASSIFKSNGTYTVETYVQDEITTNCHRLDSVMAKYGIPNVDILWMDLQGAELLALKGLGNHLQNVKYIHTEISHKEMYSGQVMYKELNDFITSQGFIIKNNLSLGGWQEDVIYEKKNMYDLTTYKSDIHSQRGHDGILQKIMKELHITSGFFIEFGAWDGIHLSNCRHLYENGWKGCFIEADAEKYKTLLTNYADTDVLCLNKYVYPVTAEGDTIDTLYKEYMKNIEVDILSIDIDGRDYEIFEHLELKPKVIIIEGGFTFHPCVRTKIPYEEAKHNIQQPLHVLCSLATKKGYTPIVFNQDTFLLRNDLYETTPYFKNIKNDVCALWKSAFYNIFNQTDRNWLVRHRQNSEIVNKYEHPYYLNLEHSLKNIFDVVIPVGPADKEFIEKQIEFTKKNIIGFRNIYLVCYDPTITIDGCITIDEKLFPFTLETVSKFHGKIDRNGWYLQQLLKLYAGTIIPDILERYLVIDADTFFLKPTTFIDNNKCLYNYGTENHMPYYAHMARLDDTLIKADKEKSGICHHMMFETKYVKELFAKIEEKHANEFYHVFLREVLESERPHSGASEYEIYFHYMLKNHSDKIVIRNLPWKNVSSLNTTEDLTYISYHWHSR